MICSGAVEKTAPGFFTFGDTIPPSINSLITQMENSQTPFEREVAACIIQALNLEISPDTIVPEQSLFQEGLGLDSIDILEISLAISKKYGVQLKADDPANIQTFSSLRSLASYVGTNRTK